MANIIKPKRSNTAAKVPNTSELLSGELGVNMADRKIYINNGTSVVQVGAGLLSALGDVVLTTPSSGQSLSYNGTNWVNSNAGAGDVVGAASSTDNAITRFDGTTGKVIQNSVVIVDDSGNVSGVNSITDPNTIGFNTAYATPLTAGQLGWDNTYNTLGFGMSGGNIIQHIGEDTYIYIKATAAITKGQVIMFTGSVGASGVLTGAPATGVTNGQYIVGVAAESIALNGFGYVQTFGELRNVNTSAFADGDILYYNSAVTGGFTTTFPTSGLIVTVAAVVNGGSVGGGVIQIRVTVTQRITASTGITVSQTNAGTSVANSGVLGVTATSPVASSGGQNPVISMPAATTSVSGYLTSTDWNTFNNKQAALVSGTNIKTVNSTTLLGSGNLAVGTVTSVSATVPTGLTVSGSPITTSGTLAITYTAGYAIPTTAKQTEWDSAYTYRVPSGGIIIWSGASTAIPSGWFLCDGLNGTPDLRDRFVVGAGSTYAVGATGGSANATLVSHTHTATSTFTGSALATHNHTASFSGTSVTPAGSVSSSFTGTSVTPAGSVSSTFTGSALATHNHTASFSGTAVTPAGSVSSTSTVTDPGHFHDLPGNTSSGSIRQTQIGVNATSVLATSSTKVTGITVSTSSSFTGTAFTPAGSVTNTAISAGTPAGSVSSSFTGTAFTPAGSVSSSFTGTAFTPAGSVTNTAISAGTPAGSVSTTNSTEGSSATNANLPPYYALCYIMKS